MTQEPRQIPLLMRSEDLATWDNWLSRPETAALEQLLRGQVPEHSAYVWGREGMGKSHILQACCDAEGPDARYIPLRDMVDFAPEQVLADAEIARLIAIDDIDCVESRAGWQEALFALFNASRETGAQLLVTANKAPQQLLEALPDLRSRLSSLPVFLMPRFTEDHIAGLLALHGAEAGIEFSDDVARYCSLRLPRHPRAVVSFINRLDQLSLAQRRAVTIPFVRESGLLRQAEG
jgi:DnaA family protein